MRAIFSGFLSWPSLCWVARERGKSIHHSFGILYTSSCAQTSRRIRFAENKHTYLDMATNETTKLIMFQEMNSMRFCNQSEIIMKWQITDKIRDAKEPRKRSIDFGCFGLQWIWIPFGMFWFFVLMRVQRKNKLFTYPEMHPPPHANYFLCVDGNYSLGSVSVVHFSRTCLFLPSSKRQT